MLRFAKLWQSENRNIKKIFRGLFDYCISEFGYIPKSELHLIWQGTAGKTVDPFFGPITGQAKDMLAKIRGMAWDMAHLQLMQKLATRNVCGSFFVPYFVSLDVRWRNLLRLNPISFVLIDDSRQTTLVGRRNEIDFQRFFQECLSERAQNELSPEKIAIRRAAAAAAKITDIKALVVKEENYWIS